MSDTVIQVENLGKKYVLGQKQERYSTLRDTIENRAKRLLYPFLKQKSKTENLQNEFWALKDISFEIKQGEVIGIIGRNGAGKSTLLKILSRITEPTKGSINLKGRVASLLEVGTGFHPELTGRENIYLNGAILGMSKVEIERKFDEIVAFAEVEKFLDTPVKRYSSGMYVRLAFAVAAHLEPEILIVDEVLAVGDAQFQKKCLGKMGEVATQEGKTILFVSHNMQAISTLTNSCLFLHRGEVIKQGSTEKVINEYLNYGSNIDHIYIDNLFKDEPKVTHIEIKTSEPGNTHLHGETCEISFEIYIPNLLNGGNITFHIINMYEQSIAHFWLFDSENKIFNKKGLIRIKCQIPKFRLFLGKYTITVYLAENLGTKLLQEIKNVCPFEIVMFNCIREYEWQEGSCTYIDEFIWEKI